MKHAESSSLEIFCICWCGDIKKCLKSEYFPIVIILSLGILVFIPVFYAFSVLIGDVYPDVNSAIIYLVAFMLSYIVSVLFVCIPTAIGILCGLHCSDRYEYYKNSIGSKV